MKIKHLFDIKFVKRLYFILAFCIAIYGLYLVPNTNIDDTKNVKDELQNSKVALETLNQSRTTATTNSEFSTKTETDSSEIDQNNLPITFIGDSVLLGASSAILNHFPNSFVDAEESRQVRQCMDILQTLDSENNLNQTVVISLGLNGYFHKSVGQELIDYLGSDTNIYWVNLYGKYSMSCDETNQVIESLCTENSNVHLIDWNQQGALHDDWFYNDGIHLNKIGQEGFANFLLQSID